MRRTGHVVFGLVLLCACGGKGGPSGFVSISVSPGTAAVDIGGTQAFTAAITGMTNAEITWSLSGPGCLDDGCGWITSSGVYSAPDSPPNPPTVTVTATIQAGEPRSASATVTITLRSNAAFQGRYAFLFNGFEADDVAVAIAGSIYADGNGNVTGGVLDSNRTEGVRTYRAIDGTYAFGADRRGRLNLNTPDGPLAFRFAMNAPNGSSQSGRLISFQTSGVQMVGAGVIKTQDPSAFSLGALNGEFVAGFLGGMGPRSRAGAVGRFILDSSGAIRNGLFDVNLIGTPYPAVGASGSAAIATADSTAGRGTARLGMGSPLGNFNFGFYVVSTGEAFFVGTDVQTADVPLLSGTALKQSDGPFAPASLSGPLAFNVTGLTPAGSEVTIGRFDSDPAAHSASGVLDSNAAGAIGSNVSFTAQFSVAANGRGTLALQGTATATNYVFYMIGRNSAFLLQSELPAAGLGTIEPQSGAPFSTASISGRYVVGTISPAECGCTSTSGAVIVNGADGTFAGARDNSRPDVITARDVWAGTFNVPTGTSGRGTLTTALPATEMSALYVVSPSKLWLINAEADFAVAAITVLEK